MENLSVLIVEDGKSDYLFLKAHLEKIDGWDVKVQSAESFEQAKQAMSSTHIDICLLDYYMENKTADFFLNEIQTIREFVPVVLVSGLEVKKLKKLANELMVDDYISKSHISDVLLERVLKYCVTNNRERLKSKNQEQKYWNLFNNSLESIFTADEYFKILRANKSFKELIKTEIHEGYDFRELFFEDDHENYFSALTHGSERNIKRAKLKNANGEILEVYLAISRILDIEDQAAYQVVIHDITEFESMQKKLYENEKISLIQRMARIIGHEVRNPLTNIFLATDEMKQDLAENEDAVIMLEMIHRNSTRISALIDKFLKNTKNATIEKEEVVLEKVILDSFENCKDRILLKQINYNLVGFDNETVLALDTEKIQIVVTNIIINAIEALEDQEKAQLDIVINKKSDLIQIIITDNGVGMTDEIKQNLFSPFYSSKQGGLGLGMANAKNIIEEHGARIDVKSKIGKGTEFVISIPM